LRQSGGPLPVPDVLVCSSKSRWGWGASYCYIWVVRLLLRQSGEPLPVPDEQQQQQVRVKLF